MLWPHDCHITVYLPGVIPTTYPESPNIPVNVGPINLATILAFDLPQVHFPSHSSRKEKKVSLNDFLSMSLLSSVYYTVLDLGQGL